MKYFTKSLITEKLPSSLSWLENSTIQYKFRNSYSNWTSQLNLRLKTDYLQLYSVDEPSDRNVLILTSPLEKIDLKVLISNCVQLKICPWVLVSEALVMSTDDFEIAVKKIGKNVAALAVSLNFNCMQGADIPVLAFNPIFSPESYFLSLPSHLDQKLLMDISSNCLYLKKKDLEITQTYSPSVYSILPKGIPEITKLQTSVFYLTTKYSHLPSGIFENPSWFPTKREELFAKILNSLLSN